jgi:hypothetical protein|tara:strand:- start:238 stop:639 length:402 start_codon:yes stop_codon:yes gene_type:complete
MKAVLIILLIVLANTSYADSSSNSLNLSMPSSGTGYQADKFRAGELDCSNAIGSATTLEFGLTSIIQGGDSMTGSSRSGDVGIFSRITIPLGKRVKNRIDCSRLYDLELQKKQLELMKLQQEINQLRSLSFEN